MGRSASSASASCLGRRGARVSARPSARPPCLRRKALRSGRVTLTMLAFGIGAAVPLAVIGLASRQAMARWRGALMASGKRAKGALGVLL